MNEYTDPLSFGASFEDLQSAAELHKLADNFNGNSIGDWLNYRADMLSGANFPGMDSIKDLVKDMVTLFGVDQVNIHYQEDSLGRFWAGQREESYDNWIGVDPQKTFEGIKEYGEGFVLGQCGHEVGHRVMDCLGMGLEKMTYLKSEIGADYLAGMTFAMKRHDPEGFARFLSELDAVEGKYLDGSLRSEIFMEGYHRADEYAFKNFQHLVDDYRFDLRGDLTGIIEKYAHTDETHQLTSSRTNETSNEVSELSSHRGKCRNCSFCDYFYPSPKDYTGNTCLCGCSYYFHG